MNKDIPMGVSQWREHGKKYGYWEFFGSQLKSALKKKLVERWRCVDMGTNNEDYVIVRKSDIDKLMEDYEK